MWKSKKLYFWTKFSCSFNLEPLLLLTFMLNPKFDFIVLFSYDWSLIGQNFVFIAYTYPQLRRKSLGGGGELNPHYIRRVVTIKFCQVISIIKQSLNPNTNIIQIGLPRKISAHINSGKYPHGQHWTEYLRISGFARNIVKLFQRFKKSWGIPDSGNMLNGLKNSSQNSQNFEKICGLILKFQCTSYRISSVSWMEGWIFSGIAHYDILTYPQLYWFHLQDPIPDRNK